MRTLPRHVTIYKQVGETPLQAAERLRVQHGIPHTVPLAYAGRLDPMAEGKLLILIGDECRKQTAYHALDKEYEFEILFGIHSDTGDVLGLVETCTPPTIDAATVRGALSKYRGIVTLPYPHFSSKTVRGKPLHMWTLENRLHEIQIPSRTSRIYSLSLKNIRTVPNTTIYDHVEKKIETIPLVTEESKALGRDFRRAEVREHWRMLRSQNTSETFTIASISCIASSGSYMRSLAEQIAKEIDTCGLAYSIRRTEIGKYLPLSSRLGLWIRRY